MSKREHLFDELDQFLYEAREMANDNPEAVAARANAKFEI
jgi:hypothetical protein